MILLLAAATGAAPLTAEVKGALYEAGGVRVAADGTVHVVVGPKRTRMSALKGIVTVTAENDDGEALLAPKVRHVALHPDGSVTDTELPGPGGAWPSDANVLEAVLDLDDDDQPIIVMDGQRCPEGCVDQLWIAVWTGDGFATKPLDHPVGTYNHVILDAGGPHRWTIAAHAGLADGTFTGVYRWDGGGAPVPWVSGPKIRPMSLISVDQTLSLLYLQKKEVHLLSADGDRVLAEGATARADAAVDRAGRVFHQFYDADAKRLRGAIAGQPVADMDQPESGWHNAITTDASGHALAAWYFYRNAYNKGVRVASHDGTEWQRWTQIKREDENVGWGLDIDVGPDGTFALAAHNRSARTVELMAWPSLADARGLEVLPAQDWTDRRRTSFLFAYGGGWFSQSAIGTSAPPEEDFTFGTISAETGRYALPPGLSLEGGFAGKVGPINLVAEYMRRNSGSEAVQTINRLQNLLLKLGIDDIPAPDTEMQLHFRAQDLAGSYSDVAGDTQPFQTGDSQLELRYVGKQGYHLGLRYHGFRGPQDVFTTENHVVLSRDVVDATFTEASFVAGWAVIDYLKKYEIQFIGPYFDLQAGIGITGVVLDFDTGPQSAAALTFPLGGDAGFVAYRRLRSLKGAGAFVRVGGRGTAQYLGTGEPDEPDPEREDPYLNFTRFDARVGPYANVGVVF